MRNQISKLDDKMPKNFRFLKMDALDMDFKDESFTHVIEKGSLDSILSGDRSTQNAKKYLSEVYRVQQPGGIYLCVSYRNVEHRLRHFQNFEWELHPFRVYKKNFAEEFYKIKEEFVGQDVLNDIINIKMDEEEKQNELEKEVEKFKKPAGKIMEHYVYICKKPSPPQNTSEKDIGTHTGSNTNIV